MYSCDNSLCGIASIMPNLYIRYLRDYINDYLCDINLLCITIFIVCEYILFVYCISLVSYYNKLYVHMYVHLSNNLKVSVSN